jgi:hypothetical protein
LAHEFVDALPARGPKGVFRWDMRFEVLAGPDKTTVTPLLARTCPDPISDQIERADAVANVTGRARGANVLLAPAELCRRTGLDQSVLADIAPDAWAWTANAINHGPPGTNDPVGETRPPATV